MDKTPRDPASSLLISLAALVIVIAGMREAQSLLVPFLLSIFIAVICASPLFWLQERGLSTAMALLAVVAGVAILGLLLGIVVGSSIDNFSQALPGYQDRIQAIAGAWLGELSRLGLDLSDDLLTYLDPGAAMGLAGSVLKGVGGLLTNGFLILLTVIFMLLEAASFHAKLVKALNNPGASVERLEHFADSVRRYMAIKTAVSLATGTAVALWLWLLGVDYPVLWGLLAFLLNYVPNIGSILAAVPAVLLAVIEPGPGTALVAGIGYIVINVLVGSVIEPRYMGKGLGLSTLVVFLSLVVWGWVLGPVGMLLSVPLTMTLKIGLEHYEETRWIAVMLGPEPEPEGPIGEAVES